MPSLAFILELSRTRHGRFLVLLSSLPLVVLLELYNFVARLIRRLDNVRRATGSVKREPFVVDERLFPDLAAFDRVLDKLEETGLRTPGGANHTVMVDWLEEELGGIPGLKIRSDFFDITKWETKNGKSLQQAGRLTLSNGLDVGIIGAVPLSRPTKVTAPILFVPKHVALSSIHDQLKGKIVVRDLDYARHPYSLVMVPSYSKTYDMYSDLLSFYDRPHSAEHTIHADLIAAGKAEAAGCIHIFDITGDTVDGYYEPHQGIHFEIPGLFVGADQGQMLKELAETNDTVTIEVEADVEVVPTRNLLAVLPGQSSERVVFVSHTDGNTLVQENGVAALLAIAKYFADQPLSSRYRTIEFVFGSCHLQVAKEGLGRHALQLLDDSYPDGGSDPVFVSAMEHLGAREIIPVERTDGGPGRRLKFSGRGEMCLWSVGPSSPMLTAVEAAVSRRKLDRVVVTRGTSMPNTAQVPYVDHFGGIGTFYHHCLFPTNALIAGPWSLWAPNFGRQAVDVNRMRKQTMALADIYWALDGVAKEEILGGYKNYRALRKAGRKAPPWPSHPSERPL